ncbi:aa3-type cytochrome oxidase subunit IV [Actinospongicola halichondriae]|uniref:aa3-type cytochrome oxidase subunit IV n=1 Tax=Actinospongicola halichondriae TaxID=3236844 RepID=UPI003D4F55C3
MDADESSDAGQVRIQSRIFLGIGAAVAVMAAIYGAAAYEEAGSVMLALAACLSLVCGTFLWFQDRGAHAGHAVTADAMYLPHSSIWPFWIGVAAFLMTNGLVLGIWFLVPGALVMIAGLVGFIRQSRARSEH